MGTWGESILADDDAQEVYEQYIRIFNQGKDHAAVRDVLERSWSESLADSDDSTVFWLAVALVQWEYGNLEEEVKLRIQKIVDEGLGLQRWQEGPQATLRKREKMVRDFLTKISQPNPKPRTRAKSKRHPPLYIPGECLAVELMDKSFAAVLVVACDDSHHTEGFDYVALLEYRASSQPELGLFETCPLIAPREDGRLIPTVRRCYASSHNAVKSRIHSIGRLSRTQIQARNKKSRFMGRWQEVISDFEYYFELRS